MTYQGTIAYRTGVGGMIHEGFAASLVAAWDFLAYTLGPSRFHFMRGQSCMLHDAANRISEGFLGDWVLFLDTDHLFASDALYEMILTFEDNQLDILTGFTQKRQPPYTPILFRTDFNPLESFREIIPQGLSRQQLLPMDSAGLSCLMVRRKVFDEITLYGEKPFDMRKKFNTVHLQTGQPLHIVHTLPPGRHWEETFWEDVSFYWRASMLGYKVFCAPWIKFHHLESRFIDESHIQEIK